MIVKARELAIYWLGRTNYKNALHLQEQQLQARIKSEIPDSLYLLEHDPVITLGLSTKPEHLLLDRETLQQRGIEVFKVNRGGDVTYHAPGQLVAYPVINLNPDRRDVRRYVWNLEEVMLRITAAYGVSGRRIPGFNGAWIENRKIGAVGVRIKKWVTMHGFSFNVTNDLHPYDFIIPCGIRDKTVTSLQNELHRWIDIGEVVQLTARVFSEVFERQISWQSVEEPLARIDRQTLGPL